jgi:hypothetical protein
MRDDRHLFEEMPKWNVFRSTTITDHGRALAAVSSRIKVFSTTVDGGVSNRIKVFTTMDGGQVGRIGRGPSSNRPPLRIVVEFAEQAGGVSRMYFARLNSVFQHAVHKCRTAYGLRSPRSHRPPADFIPS